MLIALAFTWLLFFISWFEFSPHCCYLENIFFSLYVCLSVCVSKDTFKRKCISIPRVFLNELQIQEIYGLSMSTQYIFQKANLSSKSVLGMQRDKIIWQLHYMFLIFSSPIIFLFLLQFSNPSLQGSFLRTQNHSPIICLIFKYLIAYLILV